MNKTFKKTRSALKRGFALLLTTAVLFTTNVGSVFASGSPDAIAPGAVYTVPITSLTSAAPLPPVQEAFSKAFGDSIKVTADEAGAKTAVINPQHMVVELMGSYHCNVLTIEGGTINSTEMRKVTPTFGQPDAVQDIEVPTEITLPLEGSSDTYVLTLTVDFMNAFLGGGLNNPYPTDITLVLDYDNASFDKTELSDAIDAAKQLTADNYTEESFKEFQTAIEAADAALADPALTPAAMKESVAALEAAKNALEVKPDAGNYKDLEDAIFRAGKLKEADYTEATWAPFKEALTQAAAVKDANYTADDQKLIDDATAALNKAMNALEKKPETKPEPKPEVKPETKPETKPEVKPEVEEEGDPTLDKDNLKDGTYEVAIHLWHASKDQASMAASAVNNIARIVVKNGTYTLYMYTKPMTMGSITACLQEMKVYDLNGNYTNAVVQTRDDSMDADKNGVGDPTCFSFVVPHTQEYIQVKVNPYVAMMGNQDIDARLLVNWNTLKKVNSDVNVTAPSPNEGAAPQTGDVTGAGVVTLIALASFAAALVMINEKKRRAL